MGDHTDGMNGTANGADRKNDNAALDERMDVLEAYIKRRFDELSMELNATAQSFDMAEDNLGRRFGEVLEALDAIAYDGGGLTPDNMGLELESVLKTTESAVMQILDGAEQATKLIRSSRIDWADSKQRFMALRDIDAYLQQIHMACSFQDITGQRINKTLESIRDIEDRLSGTFEDMGIHVERRQASETIKANAGNSQEEIDALFN